jgi:tetratricopeptide (TPR) repeat protein
MGRNLSALSLVSKLERALIDRDVRVGFALLDDAFKGLPKLDPESANSISFVLCLAQWTDLGYRDHKFLEGFAATVSLVEPNHLSVMDFFKLRLIDAYRYLAREQLEDCIEILDLVLRFGEPVLSDYHIFLSHFWKGRAHRKRGDYEHALQHILEAKKMAALVKTPKLVAVTQIHESWLAFQKGERTYAFALLDSAEKVLKSTGHALSLGNIESARGRFVRRAGEYSRALSHFEAAISIYRKHYPEHPNLARALVNAAYVKRLVALDLRSRRNGRQVIGAVHAKSMKISQEALQLLEQAGQIYSLHDHQGGTGSVLVNAAHIHLESGDIAQAAAEAQRAFALGKEKSDLILMSRAQIIQSAVELAHAEEQLGEEPDIAFHANSAVRHADLAIESALKTQNKRLLAEAYIARGLAAAGEYLCEWQVAKDCASKAAALLSSDDRDHLLKVLGDLRSKLLSATRIDETLRLWSDGQLGGKTFQQVQEEFAELVIPRVWLRNDKSVTQVSKALHISPKKVRRILRNVREDKII